MLFCLSRLIEVIRKRYVQDIGGANQTFSPGANGEGEREKFIFPVDHEQEWQPYPVDLFSAESADYTYIVYIFMDGIDLV